MIAIKNIDKNVDFSFLKFNWKGKQKWGMHGDGALEGYY